MGSKKHTFKQKGCFITSNVYKLKMTLAGRIDNNLKVLRQETSLVGNTVRRLAVLGLAVFLSGCFMDSELSPYYGVSVVPRVQEFRWSDGGLPRVFDPALATSPPDTDAVRALYEGLTDYDPQTGSAIPAVASRWETSSDARVWTFYLRQNANWSNGDSVTAQDFVRSWKRVLNMGGKSPNARLFENIKGATQVLQPSASPAATPTPTPIATPSASAGPKTGSAEIPSKNSISEKSVILPLRLPDQPPFVGIEALGTHTLRVELVEPDRDFASLVAHPGFRPVHVSAEPEQSFNSPISNGPFQLAGSGIDGVVLQRSSKYWDADSIQLERVRFVPVNDSESALEAYRSGQVDAVSNTALEPLAIKLLAPYKDFRRVPYAALTFYDFNRLKAPFSDARVREALAITIDRERISQDILGGSTVPADRFLPSSTARDNSGGAEEPTARFQKNIARARTLLSEAGYPNGEAFPKINLLINRNEQQRVVAQAIASMWKRALGVETSIVAKSWDEYESAMRAGEFDIVRRGVVLPTADEMVSMSLMFDPGEAVEKPVQPPAIDGVAEKGLPRPENPVELPPSGMEPQSTPSAPTEVEAIANFHAIPVFFASSYTLVKPYVRGFDANLFDAPSLKSVKIDTKWQIPPKSETIWLR
jgi:oligopeptide transport system substrate-binding protein